MLEMTSRDSEERTKLVHFQDNTISKSRQAQKRWTAVKLLVIFAVCLSASVLFLVLKRQFYDNLWSGFDFRPLEEDVGEDLPWPVDKQQEKFLGGLLPEGLDEKSCRSRYQSARYRKGLTHLPSSHLISRLRSYEALHKRCGPYTESYSRSLEHLKSVGEYNSSTDCKYVLWLVKAGLGNRMITLASAFLYALLTDRVLLVDREAQIPDLFCEPFPEVSWLIPPDFPITHKFKGFDERSPMSYRNMLKRNAFDSSKWSSIPPYIYLHLVSDYDDDDKLFFCDHDQAVLQKVPWLLMRSDLYFAPSFFLMPSFQQELSKLFPEKETVFHFLGRYLFHPANPVWRAILKYYNAHLAKADEKIGLQIRVVDPNAVSSKHVLDQILGCVCNDDLLPQINRTLKGVPRPANITSKTKAVLITSLSSDYYEAVRNMYEEHPTVTGEVVGVHQPSHDERQHSKSKMQNMEAWAEIYLLSLTDKLVTTAKSTFGYVAQSLGDLKPWILVKPDEYSAPNAPCQRGLSIEPCFQAPPMFDCSTKRWADTGKIAPYIRHCEDMSSNWGLKLFDENDKS